MVVGLVAVVKGMGKVVGKPMGRAGIIQRCRMLVDKVPDRADTVVTIMRRNIMRLCRGVDIGVLGRRWIAVRDCGYSG